MDSDDECPSCVTGVVVASCEDGRSYFMPGGSSTPGNDHDTACERL